MQRKQTENTGYWSDEIWLTSSGKWWRTEEKVSILLESELSSSIPVPSSNPRTRRKRKRIEVNSETWFDSRRSQSQNMQTKLCSSLL